MKNLLVVVLLLIGFNGFAQKHPLSFNKKFYEIENEWATWASEEKDTSFVLGLVYYDPYKGYVFNAMNSFSVAADGTFLPKEKQITGSMINVISNTAIDFAVIPKSRYKELGISEIDKAVNTKRYNENSAEDLVKKGWHLNHVGASAAAVPVLEKAQKIDATAKDLLLELTFAYNATGQFDKTIRILHIELQKNSHSPLLYRELIYALISNGQLGNAEVAYGNGVKFCKTDAEKVEMAYNIAYGFFMKKNQAKFSEWSTKVMALTSEDSAYYKNIKMMQAEINKK